MNKERKITYEELLGFDKGKDIYDILNKRSKEKPFYKEIQKILHPEKIKKLPDNFYNSEEWALKRIEILRRDNFKCVHCGNIANHVDHINSARFYPQLALESNNLISSCEECHKKRQPRGKWRK